MSSKKSFLSLLIPVAALIVTSTVVTMQTSLLSQAKGRRKLPQFTYKFQTGRNTFAPPLKTNLTYEAVCDQLGAKEILSWQRKDGQNPVTYDCTKDQTVDLRLIPNNAYTVYLENDKDWTIYGRKTTKVNYNLGSAGFFGYGEPRSETKIKYADEYCKKFTNLKTGVSLKGVYSQTPYENWDFHSCDNPADNNFRLEYGTGYILWFEAKDEKVTSPTKMLQGKLQN